MRALCPGTERQFTTIHQGLCPPLYWHPSGKLLTVTLAGVWPYLVRTANGVGGTDLSILDVLAQKFNFSISFHLINNHKEYYASVRSPYNLVNNHVKQVEIISASSSKIVSWPRAIAYRKKSIF